MEPREPFKFPLPDELSNQVGVAVDEGCLFLVLTECAAMLSEHPLCADFEKGECDLCNMVATAWWDLYLSLDENYQQLLRHWIMGNSLHWPPSPWEDEPTNKEPV